MQGYVSSGSVGTSHTTATAPSRRLEFGQASGNALSMKWSALHDAS
jgi:hypothetical protein